MLALGGLLGVSVAFAPAASAAPAPVAQRPADAFTADALPTVQIDGVIWDQVVIGDIVYAGGNFANARPSGAAPGTNQTPRSNLLAYNIRTGALVTSFAPTINGQVKTVTASPDGTRLYVGGQFTTVNGANRYRAAAFTVATGALVSNWAPAPNTTVNAIAVTDNAVYLGGAFNRVGSAVRNYLAAVSPTNGALLAWAPSADRTVNALVTTPDKSRLIAAGSFGTVNSSTAHGLASVDSANATLLPWAANNVIHNYGTTSAMLSLSSDGSTIYSTGYWFGGVGNFEGVLAAEPNTGEIKWLADCHGDTYDAAGVGGAVYSVSHHHHCENIGGFPDTNPRNAWYYANAFSTEAQGTVAANNQCCYQSFEGLGAPALVNWFPKFQSGTFTGKTQAGWSVTGTDDYLLVGGEFPSVNGTAQQGLVRFAVSSLAPKKQGPQIAGQPFNPSVVAVRNDAVRIGWTENHDRDDQVLRYDVYRSGTTAPVHTATATSQFWKRESMSFTDVGLTPGQTYRYKVAATDPDGNTVQSEFVSVTVPTEVHPYLSQVIADGASNYWRMNGTSTQVDYAGAANLTGDAGVSAGGPGVLSDGDAAAAFSGTTTGVADTSVAISGPTTFSAEAWVKTTSTSGGKILGFGDGTTSQSNNYDRHVYMTNDGQIVFGAYPGGVRTIRGTTAYNDGGWHHVVAELSSAGMALYVDGVRVAVDASTSTAQPYSGYWRVGGDNLNGWPNQPASNFLNGTIDEVAIYPTALSADQVLSHFRASTVAPNAGPVAAFTSTCADGSCSFDSSASADPDGTIASYAWDFGDGATSAALAPSHAYATSGRYTVTLTLTVTDDRGASDTVSEEVTVTVPAGNQGPTAAFTSACTEWSCSFDSSTSADPDGSIASYAWTFGDSQTSTAASPTHVYDRNGTFTVTLTVTDNRGATDVATRTVQVRKNAAPTAAFTAGCSGLGCSFDAATSADADGSIAAYAWDFGDGSPAGVGRNPTHSYNEPGTFTVRLTVTDNEGATDTETRSVVVSLAPGVIAADAFDRTVTRWGTADSGGTWTYAGSTYSTNGSTGDVRLASAGAAATASLASVSQRDVNVVADVAVDKVATGGGTFSTFIVRKAGTSDYRLTLLHQSNGTVRLTLVRTVNGTATTLRAVNVAGLSYAAGDMLRVRFVATGNGTTTLNGTVWKAGTAEPVTAQATATDATASLQAAGSFGIYSYLSGSSTNAPTTIRYDNLLLTAG